MYYAIAHTGVCVCGTDVCSQRVTLPLGSSVRAHTWTHGMEAHVLSARSLRTTACSGLPLPRVTLVTTHACEWSQEVFLARYLPWGSSVRSYAWTHSVETPRFVRSFFQEQRRVLHCWLCVCLK